MQQTDLRLCIIARQKEKVNGHYSGLARQGFSCTVVSRDEALEHVSRKAPDLVLLEMDTQPDANLQALHQRIRQLKLPLIALVDKNLLDSPGIGLNADDFIVTPGDASELALRAKRLLQKTAGSQVISCGDLTIDTARCEVSLRGSLLDLTFREYELLRFLASHRGQVFSRDTLLNKVWGYDYFGGDRTVDVHIRRLRSKTDPYSQNLIETVRHIGYRLN